MIKVKDMQPFQNLCRAKLVEWYNSRPEMVNAKRIGFEDTFIVWSCKSLQNYKALAATVVSGDGIYVEFTYNGDREELYMDIYYKISHITHTEE